MGNLGTAGRVALTKRAGVASSVTPSPALDWTPTLYCDSESSCQDYTEERVQGITQTITLALSVSSTSGSFPPAVHLRKSSTSASASGGYCGSFLTFGGYSSPIPEGSTSTLGFSQVYDGTTLLISSLTASNNDYIAFTAVGNAPPFPPSGTSTVTIQIRNSSDGSALLDTITFQQDA